MSGHEPSSCSRSYRSSGVFYLVWLVKEILDISQSWLSIEPSSSILWLLLGPADFSVFELFKLSDNFFKWEWAVAFNSQNGHIVNIILSPSCLNIVVDLSRTEYNLSNLLRSNKCWIHIIQKKVESCAIGEFFDIRASSFQSQELLWGNHDERFSKWHSHLGS